MPEEREPEKMFVERKKRRGRPRKVKAETPLEVKHIERYPKVCLLKTKAKKAMDPFKYDMLYYKDYLYLIETKDGQCLLSPRPTSASYLLAWVPEDCIKPYRDKSGQHGD